VAVLELQYPHMQTKVTAIILGRPLANVFAKATQLGLRKSAEYLAAPASGRTCGRQGINNRFPKGHVPANKGLRRPGYAPGNMAKTQFKKGQRPHTWKPIGSERINADGYRDRKVTDTGYPPRDWVGIHRLNWVAAYGPIPPGHIVAFKDGDKLNAAIENLELLTLRQNMLRNTIHVRYPKAVREVIQLAGALKRQINRRTRA
jgi:hypothetical protein